MADISDTLAQRGGRYGDFTDHARVTMALCDVVRFDPSSGYDNMPAHHRLAIDVILNKVARACTGDPMYDDNWHDIIGYAKLVEDRIHNPPTHPAVMPEMMAGASVVDPEWAARLATGPIQYRVKAEPQRIGLFASWWALLRDAFRS